MMDLLYKLRNECKIIKQSELIDWLKLYSCIVKWW